MIKHELEIREELLQACRRLYNRNMLAAADGNVSFRIADDRVLITPSGRQKAFITVEDFAAVTLDGKIHDGKPSGELMMHLEVYKNNPNAKVVIHAHPPTAIAWSLTHPNDTEVPGDCIPELILATGRIPIIPYARPTTVDMAEHIRPFVKDHRCMILARHGALTWGETVVEALNGMERIEHTVEILARAKNMGEIKPLPKDEVDVLIAMRKEFGDKIL